MNNNLENISVSGTKRDRSTITTIAFSVLFCVIMIYSYKYIDNSLRTITNSTIRSSTETSHADIVRVTSNVLNAEVEALISSYNIDGEPEAWANFIQSDAFSDFDSKVRAAVANTNVAKLKIYADDSITVYSSDLSQVGEAGTDIEHVTHALRGRSSSQIDFRDVFQSLDGELRNVNIVSSYHPLTNSKGQTFAVVEIYSDRTNEFKYSGDRAKSYSGRFLIFVSLAMSIWVGQILFAALRQRKSD